MNLSAKAIKDLRSELRKKYGDCVDDVLSDQEVGEIGVLILNILAYKVKHFKS